MSHFTKIQTSISDAFTLTSVLTRLDLSWEKIDDAPIGIYRNNILQPEFLIQQLNNPMVKARFIFNGVSYELIADKSFWNQPLSLEALSEHINQDYSIKILNDELEEIGFSTINYIKLEQGLVDVTADKWVVNLV